MYDVTKTPPYRVDVLAEPTNAHTLPGNLLLILEYYFYGKYFNYNEFVNELNIKIFGPSNIFI